ncbi:hypothetical protein [Trebonia sp.]|uniref:hypothetical protein n=1 Tax=Trebonia sp. TaxID=2767075 RepID=UPI002607E01A|nr:hypothetical protein [Trebonia sp.]
MIEAVKTTASPTAIWVIVVVAVVCLAIWLGGILWLGEHPLWAHHMETDMPGPVLGGVHVAEGGRSVSPNREAPATFTEPPAQVPSQRTGVADQPEHSGAGQGAAGRRAGGA